MNIIKVISHRGNLNGPSKKENHPNQIGLILDLDLDCEIDVRYKGGEFFLGHDIPEYKVEAKWLLQEGLWCHAKNGYTLQVLLDIGAHCFFHQSDDHTLTSRGYIWTYPQRPVTKNSVIVNLSPLWYKSKGNCYGVCTDYPTATIQPQ